MSRQYICSTCAGDPRWTTEFYRAVAQDNGALLIEKRLRPGHPFGRSMPDRERRTTLQLAKMGLPVARLRPPDYYDAWSVISEFVGPNLRWMTLHEQTSTTDAAALWQAATLATAHMADARVMVTDWAARNVAFPLSGGLSGRARYGDPRLLDHAFTQIGAADAEVQKGNIWMRADQGVLAPEVRRLLRDEQAEALAQVKAMTGGAVQDLADLPARQDCEELFGRVHLGATSLQARLRDGSLDPDRAMQHAIGHEALTLLARYAGHIRSLDGVAWLQAREQVFRKMSTELPADRYESLTEAARAMVAVHGKLPEESSFALPVLDLKRLIRRPSDATRPLEVAGHGPADAVAGEDAGGADGTLPLEPEPLPASLLPPPSQPPAAELSNLPRTPRPTPQAWKRAAALVLGAAALVALSLPGPDSAEALAAELARRQVVTLANEATRIVDAEALRNTLRELVRAAGDHRPKVHAEAERQLAMLWGGTKGKAIRLLLSDRAEAGRDVERLVPRLLAFADAGYGPAAALGREVAASSGCGASVSCIRRVLGRFQAAGAEPVAAKRAGQGAPG
jgi:hypothetical protein